ncbi:LysM peptidoglycan-binding domain-containing protein [Salinicoccus carnicancri]|uniref:LysM peptidoglycan-binding domain-containing protein n=1 Tax=Salinicoccus carnicancri TaxID=558170 RepID=UPI0002D4F7E3|nr:LysM peptidoglycan-binding domain-containing protein [Salinicoccus carnicancri]
MKKVLTVGAAVAVSGTLAYSAEAASHTVDTGDTLWGLAQENNTSVESIKSSNELSSDIILPGQVLEIGGEEKTEEQSEEKTETAEEGLYTIKAGDTLFEIAQQFNVTVSDLKAWNNLSSDLIFAGKTITVSGENAEQAPAVEAPQVEEEPAQQNEAENQAQQEEQAAAEQQAQEEAAQQRAEEQAAEERAAAEKAAQQQKQQEKQQVKTENQSTSANSSGQNWGALAQCESGGNSSVVSSNGLYHGLYQFDVRTWKSVGGSGLPSQASAAEQTKRAQILFDQRGSQPWPVCGSRL